MLGSLGHPWRGSRCRAAWRISKRAKLAKREASPVKASNLRTRRHRDTQRHWSEGLSLPKIFLLSHSPHAYGGHLGVERLEHQNFTNHGRSAPGRISIIAVSSRSQDVRSCRTVRAGNRRKVPRWPWCADFLNKPSVDLGGRVAESSGRFVAIFVEE